MEKEAVSHLKMVKKELSANLIDRLTNQDNCISIDRWFPFFCVESRNQVATRFVVHSMPFTVYKQDIITFDK